MHRSNNRLDMLVRSAPARVGVALCCAIVMVVVLVASSVTSQAPTTRGFVVIAHAQTSVPAEKRFVTNAFLKKVTLWPDGTAIRPVDLPIGSPVRERFSDDVLGRSVNAMRHYWNQVIFSGRGTPPSQVATDEEVINYVTRHPGAIGYVSDGAQLHSGVRVVRLR